MIVGRADDCHIPPEEPALEAKVPEDSDMRGQWGRRPQETIDRANELLDNFANQLKAHGIRVDRPTSIDHSQICRMTPDFQTGKSVRLYATKGCAFNCWFRNSGSDDVISV